MTRAAGKPQSRYVCQSCGESFLRWEGQCRACAAWNSLVETVVREPRRPASAGAILRRARPAGRARLRRASPTSRAARSGSASSIASSAAGSSRARSCWSAASRGSASRRSCSRPPPASPRSGAAVLYATGEESAAQVRLRAARLGLLEGPARDGIRVVAEAEIGRIAEIARDERPQLVVVDSIQTATVGELDGPAGSVGQVRESALRLMELAKGEGIAVVLVGHVTKDGSLAGPKTLEHLVDAVLALEGERYASLRLVRASKNRFGSTEEVGVFEMGEAGMAEVTDPARAFLADHDEPAPGSVVAPTLEGSRPILVEVQALVAPGAVGSPAADGERRRSEPGRAPHRGPRAPGRHRAASHDVYVNLAGGLSVGEPGLDLPIALALASSLRDRPVRDRNRRDRRGRPARRAAAGRGPRATPARGRATRLRAGRRPARGARRALSPPSRDGDRRGRVAARGDRARHSTEPPSVWRALRHDARLTAAPPRLPGPSRPATAGGRSREHVIRNIRLLGIALGGLVGLALARPAGLLVSRRAAGST